MGQVISTRCPTIGEQRSLVGDHTYYHHRTRTYRHKLDGRHIDGLEVQHMNRLELRYSIFMNVFMMMLMLHVNLGCAMTRLHLLRSCEIIEFDVLVW